MIEKTYAENAEIIFRFFNDDDKSITAISDKTNLTRSRVNRVINEYLKPRKRERGFVILESKMNQLID